MPPEPGTIKVIVEILLKPFALIFNPVAERVGNMLKRKPKLHIYVRPLTKFLELCMGRQPESDDAGAIRG